MFHLLPARWLAALSAFVGMSVFAQPAPTTSTTTAPLPAAVLSYQSTLDGYQGWRHERPVGWRDANQTVYNRGGFKAYAKEMSESPDKPKGPTGTSDPHAGHAMPPPAAQEQR